MEREDRLLPALAHARGVAPPLGLGLDPRGAHALDPDAEDLLHRLADLGLVRAVVYAEGVLVGTEQGVALLRDHGAHDDLAGVHDGAPAIWVSRSSAGSDTTRRAADTTSAIPAWLTCSTLTAAMFRNDLTAFSSPSASTTSTVPSPSSLSRALTASLVEGASKPAASTTASEPRSAWSESAARSARRRALQLTLKAYPRGLGPKIPPPPVR